MDFGCYGFKAFELCVLIFLFLLSVNPLVLFIIDTAFFASFSMCGSKKQVNKHSLCERTKCELISVAYLNL